MDPKDLVDFAAPYITTLVKKELPDADEPTIGQVLIVLGTLLSDIGTGLQPKTTA